MAQNTAKMSIPVSLKFPVRKSSRCKQKENQIAPVSMGSLSKSKVNKNQQYGSKQAPSDLEPRSELEDERRSKQSQESIRKVLESTPKKSTVEAIVITPTKRRSTSAVVEASPPKIKVIQETATLLPLSPRKSAENMIVLPCASPKVRRQLVDKENDCVPQSCTRTIDTADGSLCSPKKLMSVSLFDSPRKIQRFSCLPSPRKMGAGAVKSPLKSDQSPSYSSPVKFNALSYICSPKNQKHSVHHTSSRKVEMDSVVSPQKTEAETCVTTRQKSETVRTPQTPNRVRMFSPNKTDCSDELLSPRVRSLRTTLTPHVVRSLNMVSPRKADVTTCTLSPSKDERSTFLTSKLPYPGSYDSQMEGTISRAKHALNTQQPDYVIGRDHEIKQIKDFLAEHLIKQRPGSLYISGAPGTGKTAVLKHLLSSYDSVCPCVFINSMTIKSPLALYKTIASDLDGCDTTHCKTSNDYCQVLQQSLTSDGPTVLLILDEMDQLDSKNQQVLYTIFEWPSLPRSRLVLIGIANALDLTDRILPRLHIRLSCRPQLLNFAPYTKEQIILVLNSRLQKVCHDEIVDPAAIQYCAKKVAAIAGDMRKALDICRRSIEMSEPNFKKQELLSSKGKGSTANKVGVQQVAKVIDEVFGSVSQAAKPSTFPLQQKLVVCTLVLLLKNSKLKEMSAGKVHDAYSQVCRKQGVAAVDQTEFLSLCSLLETRGLISMKNAKQSRQSKISLKLDMAELEFALQDKMLISSVLQQGF